MSAESELKRKLQQIIDKYEMQRANFEHEWTKNAKIKMPTELDKSRAQYAEGYARALKHVLEDLKGLFTDVKP